MTGRRLVWITLAGIALGSLCVSAPPRAASPKKAFTTQFDISSCTFSTTGRNRYFVLDPGFEATLKGVEDKQDVEVRMTVLNQEQSITIGGRQIMTRVLEEREFVDGALDEVSLNYFAICDQTNSVYYFGEDVDDYEDGQIVGHGGAWKAGQNGATPGIAMPGDFLLGARYAQEAAPGVAEDRSENVKAGLEVDVPAGHFTGVVMVRESSPLEKGSKETKLYAPGVGVIVDETLELTDYFDPGP
jgi:hypothetical protein